MEDCSECQFFCMIFPPWTSIIQDGIRKVMEKGGGGAGKIQKINVRQGDWKKIVQRGNEKKFLQRRIAQQPRFSGQWLYTAVSLVLVESPFTWLSQQWIKTEIFLFPGWFILCAATSSGILIAKHLQKKPLWLIMAQNERTVSYPKQPLCFIKFHVNKHVPTFESLDI